MTAELNPLACAAAETSERSFALAPGKSRGDLDGRQPARRDAASSELPSNTGTAGFLHVALTRGNIARLTARSARRFLPFVIGGIVAVTLC